ncbi:unnamed protein product [Chrysoparadoxa australica]
MPSNRHEEKEDDSYFLLDKVKEYCYSNDLEADFEQFAEENIGPFLPLVKGKEPHEVLGRSAEGQEHDLVFMEIYDTFLKNYERKIGNMIEETGCDIFEFQSQCKQALNEMDSEFSPRRFFIEALLSTTDYERFFSLMVSEAMRVQGSRDREDEECKGPSSAACYAPQ